MAVAVVVLLPHVAGHQIVQRRDRLAPRDLGGGLQPLRVLQHHRVDDAEERLVAREHSVPAGEQVPLEPPLAAVLAQDLHHASAWRERDVGGLERQRERARRRVEHRLEPVRRGLVRREEPEVAPLRVVDEHAAQIAAEDARRVGRHAPGRRHVHRVRRALREVQRAQLRATVRAAIAAERPVPRRKRREHVGARRAVIAEERVGTVAAEPSLECREVHGIVRRIGDRDLMRAHRALERRSVEHRRTRPSLRRAQDDGGPHRGAAASCARIGLDHPDAVECPVERAGELCVHGRRLVAGDLERLVPHAAEVAFEIAGRASRED